MGEINDIEAGQNQTDGQQPDPAVAQNESRIQQEIFRWYHNTYCLAHHVPRCLIFAIPNEGNWMLQQVGLLSGASDLVIFHRTEATAALPPRVIFMEVKTPTGKQSGKQRAFEAHVRAMGLEYCLVRSVDGAKAAINGESSGIQAEMKL